MIDITCVERTTHLSFFRSLFGRAFIHSSPAWPEFFFSSTKYWFKHNCKENVIVCLTSLGNSVQSGLMESLRLAA